MWPSWTPVRKGKIYCSPACGAGCTHAQFMDATRNAKAMAKLLPGWEATVHENMGWFYSLTRKITNEESKIYTGADGFWCSLHLGRQFIGEGPTPKAALDKAMQEARKLRDIITQGLEDL